MRNDCYNIFEVDNYYEINKERITLFIGKTYEIQVYSFSFKEFMKYFNYENAQDAFEKYVLEGGMAGSYIYNDVNKKYNYINDVCDAFAFYKIRRYDIQGKRYLSSVDKYYLVDQTFKYAKLGTKNMI